MSIINQLFDVISDLSAESLYTQAKSRFQFKHNDEDINNIKLFLNDAFYNNSGKSQNYNKLIDATTAYLENNFNQTLNSYDFGENLLNSKMSNEAKIELNNRTSFSHKDYTFKSTVEKKYIQAKTALGTISGKNSKEIIEIRKQFQELISSCEELLRNGVPTELYDGNLVYKTDQNADLISKIDALYKEVTFFNNMPLTVYDTGYVFEKSLQALGLSNFADRTIDELIDNFNSKTKGLETVSRGNLLNTAISYSISEDGKIKSNDDTLSLKYQGSNGSYYNITSVFSNKQGKMDVELVLPEISDKTFRVSAKNWQDLNNDFGSAYLLDTILRSTENLDYTLAYGISYKNLNRQPKEVHYFAKLCVALDILAGYSQRQGYADTVVINNRKNREILVYSIPMLIDNIYKNIKSFNLTGYDNKNIKSALNPAFGKNKINLDGVVNGLRSIQVTLKYSNLILE